MLGAIRRGPARRRAPGRVLARARPGRGQHEINLDYGRGRDGRPQQRVQVLAAKEIAHFAGRVGELHGEVRLQRHRFRRATSTAASGRMDGKTAVLHDDHHGAHGHERRVPALPGRPDRHRTRVQPPLGTGRSTVTSDFSWASWAPAGVGWGLDNRTLGFRKVGHGQRKPPSSAAFPAATRGPSQSRSPATLAGGMYGIRNELGRSARPYIGNGYEAADIHRIPWTIVDAIKLWEESDIARECFGDDVHHHILHDGQSRVAGLQPNRDGLGARPLLRTHLRPHPSVGGHRSVEGRISRPPTLACPSTLGWMTVTGDGGSTGRQRRAVGMRSLLHLA